MPTDDIKTYATSTTDFYALLTLTPTCTQRDLDRAWRRTALKYHPDKVGASDVGAREKFHLAQIGYDVLSDPAVKALYDNARTAREQKKRQNELFEGKRRTMKDELEGREKGVKRKVDGGEEEAYEREIGRLAEDGKRRRHAREEALRRDIQREEKEEKEAKASKDPSTPQPGTPAAQQQQQQQRPQGVPELDRTIKLRFPRTGAGTALDGVRLQTLFSTFGPVENAFLLKDKKARLGTSREKQLVATGVVVFKSVVGAHAAVDEAAKQKGKGLDWDVIESVFWAAGKEPEFLAASSLPRRETATKGGDHSAPSTPLKKNITPFNGMNTPLSENVRGNGADAAAGLRKVPSFASFSSSAVFSTPAALPFGKGAAVGSPSLEEITMIRLRQAEKRRLEEEIAREDAVADAKVSL